MQELSSHIWPLGWHPGGLGWWLGRSERSTEDVVVLRSGGDLLGWASRADEHEATVDVEPYSQAAAEALVAWLGPVSVVASPDNGALVRALEAEGFSASSPWRGLWLDARGRPPALPAGYLLREVLPGESAERIEVHRAAWRPADLPYAPGRRPDVAPDATSSFDAPMYERVRSSWLYDPALDLVAVAPDGSFAACCIGWFDPGSGTTEVEPLGVRPEHRRLGLAGALCLEVALRTLERDGRAVFINADQRQDYPAPAAAYLKAGFKPVPRGSIYRRPGDRTM